MPEPQFEYGVFINCPFDDAYRPLFEAIVFAVQDCGYIARCSLEVTDASQVRIERIAGIIASCKFGIHDISRTELDPATNLPRFNMPLELGMFLGAKRFGPSKHKSKTCLILDVERYDIRNSYPTSRVRTSLLIAGIPTLQSRRCATG
jgi:hypothetical protein